MERAGDEARKTLDAENADLAAAGIQQHAIALIEAEGAAIDSAEILPSEETEFFQKVSVRLTLSADVVKLQRIIHALESAEPWLFIDDLDVRLRRPGEVRASRIAKDDLLLRFVVFGFLEAADS